MKPLANWLASALPVADAVSFEFDDINVTSQHVMTLDDASDALRLCDGRLLALNDQLIKDYPGSRVPGALVFLWKEMWARSEIQRADDRLLPQLAEQQRDRCWWREPHAASNKDTCASVIYRPSRRLMYDFHVIIIYTLITTRDTMYSSAGTLYKPNYKIKYKYQGI